MLTIQLHRMRVSEIKMLETPRAQPSINSDKLPHRFRAREHAHIALRTVNLTSKRCSSFLTAQLDVLGIIPPVTPPFSPLTNEISLQGLR